MCIHFGLFLVGNSCHHVLQVHKKQQEVFTFSSWKPMRLVTLCPAYSFFFFFNFNSSSHACCRQATHSVLHRQGWSSSLQFRSILLKKTEPHCSPGAQTAVGPYLLTNQLSIIRPHIREFVLATVIERDLSEIQCMAYQP